MPRIGLKLKLLKLETHTKDKGVKPLQFVELLFENISVLWNSDTVHQQ